MRGLKNALLTAVLVTSFPASTDAASVCAPVTVDAPTMGIIAGAAAQAEAEAEICNQIKNKFQTANLSQVMNYMAKANTLSGKGATADYWSNPQVFTLGVATTLSVNNLTPPFSASDLESLKKKYTDSAIPDGGTSISANASLGISFRHMGFRRRGWFDPKNFNVYFSGLLTPTINYQTYSFKTMAFGAYVQYKALPMRKIPFGLITWGGVDIGIGYSFASTTFGISSADKIVSVPFTASGQSGVYEPTGTLTFKYTSHLIPVEISSNFSLLYFLSFAVGMAADFHILSSAEISANIDGKVKIDGQAQGSDYARFSQSESSKITTVGFRAFFGPQINIWKIRVFVLGHVTADQTYAVTTGARFAW
jgi:hypothetical protein